MPAQDQGELFDLVDREGRPLGLTKPRREVHRDGDWHRSLHIWIWGVVGGAPHLVFQRRSAGKDTHPRAIDVAVTGHLGAGESAEDALREAEEEIGLHLGPGDLLFLGRRRRMDRSKPGLLDNELQDIFFAAAPADVLSLQPSPAELEAILAVPLDLAERAFQGATVSARRLVPAGEGGPSTFVGESLSRRDFVPAEDGYYEVALRSVSARLRGERPEPWEIG